MAQGLKAAKMRDMSLEDLELRAAELQKEMFDLRLRLTTKEEANTALLRDNKREYARLLTVLNERRMEAS